MTNEELLKRRYYQNIHRWLRKNFEKANKCENPNCEHKSNRFEYALKKNFSYEFKRENFIQLCKKCHIAYDISPEWNRQKGKTWDDLYGKERAKEMRKKLSKTLEGNTRTLGLKMTEQTKEQMSKSQQIAQNKLERKEELRKQMLGNKHAKKNYKYK